MEIKLHATKKKKRFNKEIKKYLRQTTTQS